MIALGAVGAGTGVGAKIYNGVHVWLSGGKVATVVHSGVILRQPMAPDLRRAIAGATFPVVFPVGVPAGSRVNFVTVAPAGRPSAITVSYQNKTGFRASFALLDPSVVSADAPQLPSGSVGIGTGTFYHWRVGGEIVAVRDKISPDDLDRIKAAMSKASPLESLAATETMLPKITVLGGTVRLEIAERYRPASGRSVLIDQGYLRSISRLAERGEPMLDSRVSTVTDVRYKSGDLSSARVVKAPKIIAISPGGVRAIVAVLRSRGEGRDCGCEILFNQPTRTAYWVWNIPLSGPARATKYSVDARTFAVTPLTEP